MVQQEGTNNGEGRPMTCEARRVDQPGVGSCRKPSIVTATPAGSIPAPPFSLIGMKENRSRPIFRDSIEYYRRRTIAAEEDSRRIGDGQASPAGVSRPLPRFIQLRSKGGAERIGRAEKFLARVTRDVTLLIIPIRREGKIGPILYFFALLGRFQKFLNILLKPCHPVTLETFSSFILIT